jgi:hypothetical protein
MENALFERTDVSRDESFRDTTDRPPPVNSKGTKFQLRLKLKALVTTRGTYLVQHGVAIAG